MKIVGMYFGLDGRMIQRTPIDYPYSYDEYLLWRHDYHKDKSKTVYSDRLYQWDSKKYDKCCEEIFGNHGQYFDDRNPKDINKFLNMYLGKEVKLTAVLQGCNRSTGYPFWKFVYEEYEE